jgi:hypothetical protein
VRRPPTSWKTEGEGKEGVTSSRSTLSPLSPVPKKLESCRHIGRFGVGNCKRVTKKESEGNVFGTAVWGFRMKLGVNGRNPPSRWQLESGRQGFSRPLHLSNRVRHVTDEQRAWARWLSQNPTAQFSLWVHVLSDLVPMTLPDFDRTRMSPT